MALLQRGDLRAIAQGRGQNVAGAALNLLIGRRVQGIDSIAGCGAPVRVRFSCRTFRLQWAR